VRGEPGKDSLRRRQIAPLAPQADEVRPRRQIGERVRALRVGPGQLEWIEPLGGCVCFPRIKKNISVDIDKFHDVLLNKYSTYVGRGHWFEEDGRYMRIGYSWDKTEKLEKGLSNILKAIEEAI